MMASNQQAHGQPEDGGRPDQQLEDQALMIPRSGNQLGAEAVPFAPLPEISQSAVVQQISGCGNLAITTNAPGCTVNIIQTSPKDDVQAQQQSCSVNLLENQPVQTAAAKASGEHVYPTAEPVQNTVKSNSPNFSHDPLSQSAANGCASVLRTWYRTTGSYVQLIPWVDDDTKHIMDIYTSLELENKEEGLRTFCKENRFKPLESYDEIFLQLTRDGDPIKVAVIRGLTGRGKSTLIDKMAYDWAVGKALKKYKLVFVLRMHELEQGSDLIQSIFDQLLPEQNRNIDRGALKLFINNNPDQVLILMDGFNEFTTPCLCDTSFGTVLKTLKRKTYRECWIVVTTRPSHFDILVTKQLVQKPFTLINILGYSPKGVSEYVCKFYSGEHDKGLGLFERIQNSEVLSDLAESPMLLLLMCLLWREDSKLPDTMSRLYNEVMEYIFKRKGNVPLDKISEVVIEIGRVSLGFLSPNCAVSFRESDFERDVLDMAISAGLLTRQRVVRGLGASYSVEFIHKTFQEFCAAKYLQSLVETDAEEFRKILDEIVSNDPQTFGHLLRFCSGDSWACTNDILQALQLRFSVDSSLRMLALNCYFESQATELPPATFITSVITGRVHLQHWDGDSLYAFVCFLNHVADRTRDTGNVYLATVKEVVIRNCSLGRFSAGLARSMGAMVNLSTLTLSQCSLNGRNVTDIASQLGNATNLTRLDLSGNQSLGYSADVLLQLVHLKCLKQLTLTGCNIKKRDVKNLVAAVGGMKDLVDCLVDFDSKYPSCPVHLVQQTNDGIRLDLNKCALGCQELADCSKALADRSDLVELILHGNKLLSGLAAHWADHLMLLRHLQRIDLSCCSLTGQDMKYVGESLSSLSDLAELDLSHNTLLGGSAALWSRYLDPLKKLQKLNLRCCSVNTDDVRHIAVSAHDLPDLIELNLSYNQELGGSASLWSPYLKYLKQLQSLDVTRCSLSIQCVRSLAESVGCMENLEILVGFGDMTVSCFVETFKSDINESHKQSLSRAGMRNSGKD